MTLAAILGLLIQVSLFLVVMGYGLQASVDDILYLFRRPGQLVRALISLNVIMPIFAVVVVMIFELNPVIEVALVALALSPVPPILPTKALKSGGARSFTFGLLAAVSLLSIIVVPAVFRIIEVVSGRDGRFSESGIVKTIVIGVISPLIIGMVIRNFAPTFSERYAGILGKVGMILLVLAFLPMLLALLPRMWSLIGNGTIVAIAAFTLVGITVGHFLGGPDPNDRIVLAIATASRHPAISISLATANVSEDESKAAIAAVLLYVLVSTIVTTPYVAWLSRGKANTKEQLA